MAAGSAVIFSVRGGLAISLLDEKSHQQEANMGVEVVSHFLRLCFSRLPLPSWKSFGKFCRKLEQCRQVYSFLGLLFSVPKNVLALRCNFSLVNSEQIHFVSQICNDYSDFILTRSSGSRFFLSS